MSNLKIDVRLDLTCYDVRLLVETLWHTLQRTDLAADDRERLSDLRDRLLETL